MFSAKVSSMAFNCVRAHSSSCSGGGDAGEIIYIDLDENKIYCEYCGAHQVRLMQQVAKYTEDAYRHLFMDRQFRTLLMLKAIMDKVDPSMSSLE